MSEPLIPFSLYASFIDISKDPAAPTYIPTLNKLITSLPEINYVLLHELISFLVEVAAHSKKNRMIPDNIAIVFAPNLLRPEIDTPASMMTEMPLTIKIVSSFLTSFEDIFTRELPVWPEDSHDNIADATDAAGSEHVEGSTVNES